MIDHRCKMASYFFVKHSWEDFPLRGSIIGQFPLPGMRKLARYDSFLVVKEILIAGVPETVKVPSGEREIVGFQLKLSNAPKCSNISTFSARK